MPANTSPIFPLEGQSVGVLINAANTAADGTGTLFDLVTATTNGTRIDGVIFTNSQATVGAAAAKVCRMFLTDLAGANPLIVGEIALPAATRSAIAIGQRGVFFFEKAIILKVGQKIKVSSSVRATSADDIAAVPFSGNY